MLSSILFYVYFLVSLNCICLWQIRSKKNCSMSRPPTEGNVQITLSESLLICLIVTLCVHWFWYEYVKMKMCISIQSTEDKNDLLDIKQISAWHFNFHVLVLLYRINNQVGMKHQKNGPSKILSETFFGIAFHLVIHFPTLFMSKI